MVILCLSFAVSLAVTLLLIRSSKLHAHRSGDSNFSQPQKFHAQVVPRIGGAALVIGIAAGLAALPWVVEPGTAWFGFTLLLCASPAFIAGFIEDFTAALSPRGRLVATAVSAMLAFFLMDAAITRTAIPGLDWVVGFAAGSLMLTLLAVTGIANAVNIIDGLNGLASMCVVLMLAAVAYVAFQCGDPLIGSICLAGIGAVLGFFPFNYPAGLIFLGDGGAYLLGFLVAELSILLLVRNPGEVSPLFPLLVCIYPAFETLFSIYRRHFLRAVPPSLPDGIHLHSLIYRRVMRWAVADTGSTAITRRNSMSSPYLWILCMFSVAPAVLFWNNTTILALFVLLFGLSYATLYWRIVRFKSPRWLTAPPRIARRVHKRKRIMRND